MDFDTVAGELYGGDLAEFVSARNAAAKAAKAAGDAELAKRIQQLRKPTTAAAIVNGLAGDDSGRLRELAELGAELRDAHTRLAGDELRALTRRRGELVRRVLHELPSMSDTVSREVEATLEAVAADPDTAALALAGRLTSVAHQDTDQWFSLAASVPPVTGKLVDKAEPARPKRDHRREEEERARARAERERLRREAAARDKDRAVAERDLVRTERAAEQATARVDDLRERLAEAEERAERAKAEFETAKAAFDEADAAAVAARKAADAAR
ncbi:hypothetical protein [Amycolatopsis sp. MtRt-6]|uniref:hypothetical protein n=1 Tax=Amycolatopsis sp. MtRt-6 TaxID=2792782 RepID=UPI001A8F154D|nr:hypothetical protein [Amycolatopsis sp. MtRt-6]